MSEEVTIEKVGSSIIINGITEKPIKIPSQMYPLTGELCYIDEENTEDFPDNPTTDKIKEIYDSIQPGVGTCYQNIEKLIVALAEGGIKAHPMVGWLFIGNSIPVHHCFALIDNHVLDFSPKPDIFFTEEFSDLGIDATRNKMADTMIELMKKPNSETTTFGKVSQFSHYFASPCKPMAGLKVYQKLIKTFPKHPCYKNINSSGLNKTQELYYKKAGK